VDVGSANGVFVNERRVSGALLRDGDRIDIGPYRLEFRWNEGETRREERQEDQDVLERNDGFDLLQEVGRGGMAVVYKAVSVSSGQMVAVKVPLLDFQEGNSEILDRFRGEARLTLRLRHPHIIRVHHEGLLDDGRPYIVMEYLPGGALRHRMLKAGGPLPEPQIRAVGAQIAGALGYAHGQGVIHRDIKPENILFSERSEAKITDFGIALVEGGKRLTQVGPPVGTVHYQSPEQFQGTKTTPQSDLYALGCMLHEMATGQCPFEGSYAQVMRGHLDVRPAAVRSSNPRISSGLNALILELLNKSPKHRPSDAAVVADLLAKG
jgi:serine/threonine-protein kinase